MATRGPVHLVLTFGPTSSPLFGRAVSLARTRATEAAEVSPRVWRASFTLQEDPHPYAWAWRLLGLVGGWRGTLLDVQGSPEPLHPVQAMLSCARGWLRQVGRCRAPFPAGPWPKCGLCPLYDEGWARESFASPGPFAPPEPFIPPYGLQG